MVNEPPVEVLEAYQRALVSADYEAAASYLFEDPAESHPPMKAASREAQEKLVGITHAERCERLAAERSQDDDDA